MDLENVLSEVSRMNNTYKNPILYADYSDPDAIRVGEDYFMVASSFSNAPGLPLLHSKDLVNWKVVNYCIKDIPDERYSEPVHGCGVWAPSIRYHQGLYYVYFPMPDEGIYVTTARDPFGEWSRPVCVRAGAGWIDPCPFWDEDGNAYLVAGVAKSRIGYKSVLHMVRMTEDGMSVFGEEVKVFDGNENDQTTIEGPKLYKKNGYYYIFAPAGGVKPGWQTVLRSKNIWGPYEYRVVMRQGNTEINGPNQGAWVDTVTGEDWFIHFQDVFAAGRIVHLQPMHWEEDWPVIGVKSDDSNEYGEPVSEYRMPNVGKIYEKCSPDASDDFSKPVLGLQWQWNANYKESWYELSKDGLKLSAVYKEPDRNLIDVPNLLIQKWPAKEFSVITRLYTGKMKAGDVAGVVSVGMDYGAAAVRKSEKGLELISIIGSQSFKNSVASSSEERKPVSELVSDRLYVKYDVTITDTTVTLEGVTRNQERITISVSSDGKNYDKVCEYMAKPGRWVGVKNGVFCYSEKKESTGYLLVENVTYTLH